MARKCSPPKTVSVKGYVRYSGGKRRKKASGSSSVGGYVVRNSKTGKTSGTRHKTLTAAVAARKRLDRAARRAGQGSPWEVQKA